MCADGCIPAYNQTGLNDGHRNEAAQQGLEFAIAARGSVANDVLLAKAQGRVFEAVSVALAAIIKGNVT